MSILGAVLTIAGFSATGFALSYLEKQNCLRIDALLRFSIKFRLMIENTKLPLDEIISSFQDKQLEICGFLPALKENSDKTAEEKWKNAVLKLGLPPELEERAYEAGERLGLLDTAGQCEKFTALEAFLKPEYERMKSELSSKSKLYKSLSTSFGIIIALLLL